MKIKTKKDIAAVLLVSAYLLVYCVLLQFESMLIPALLMLSCSPLLLIAMVYIILKHGKFEGADLGDEEFGYQDRSKNDLGTF